MTYPKKVAPSGLLQGGGEFQIPPRCSTACEPNDLKFCMVVQFYIIINFYFMTYPEKVAPSGPFTGGAPEAPRGGTHILQGVVADRVNQT